VHRIPVKFSFSQGWGQCLNNEPRIVQPFDDILPGVIFDLDEQCRLAMGPQSNSCFPGDEPPIVNCYTCDRWKRFFSPQDICAQMMCTQWHDGRSICLSTLTNQPADGTICNSNKVSVQITLNSLNVSNRVVSKWSMCTDALSF
jgi:hypothetical protein